MKKTKEQYVEDFISICQQNDPKSLINIWYSRANDDFYKILEEIKNLTNKYFKEETNPIVFAMIAYCFDGDRLKTLEKITTILSSIIDDKLFDKIRNLHIGLNEEYDTLIDTNDKISIGQYFDFVLAGFDSHYGIKLKNIRVNIDNPISYTLDIYADKDEFKWLKENLCKENTYNLTVSLYGKFDDSYYDLFYITDSHVISDFIDKIENEDVVSITLDGKIYIISDTNMKFIEDIKSNIENILNTLENETL